MTALDCGNALIELSQAPQALQKLAQRGSAWGLQ